MAEWSAEEAAEWLARFPADAEYERRAAAIVRLGLDVFVEAEVLPGGLAALRLTPAPGFVQLPLAPTPWPLHLSLFYRNWDVVDELAWRRVRRRYHGQRVRLRIARISGGATAVLAASDPIARDRDIRALHDAGYYAGRELHISL